MKIGMTERREIRYTPLAHVINVIAIAILMTGPFAYAVHDPFFDERFIVLGVQAGVAMMADWYYFHLASTIRRSLAALFICAAIATGGYLLMRLMQPLDPADLGWLSRELLNLLSIPMIAAFFSALLTVAMAINILRLMLFRLIGIRISH